MTSTLRNALATAGFIAVDVLRQGPAERQGITEQDAWIRHQVTAVRRLDFIGLAGGVGCSQVVSWLATLLAARRGGRVLGIDAGRTDSLVRLTHATAAAPTPQRNPATSRRLHAEVSVNRSTEAAAQLLVAPSGLQIARVGGDGEATSRPTDWWQTANPLLRFFDIAITDWGCRYPGTDFEPAVSGSHAVALVCRAERPAVEAAVSVASALLPHVACLVCVVDVDGVGPTATRTAEGWNVAPMTFIPFVATPGRTPSMRLRRTMIGLAASLMEMSLTAKAPEASSEMMARPAQVVTAGSIE